jgi:arylsulfatase A-like enzyme
MIELVDVAPTLLQAAGLPAYAGMQGRSLWPLLTGASDARGRDNVYAEYYQAIPSGYQPDGAYATAVRTKLYAVSRVHRRDDGELYDLRKDPHEQHNLWRIPEMQAVKTEMLALLCDRMAETIDPLPPCRAGY